MTNQMVRFFITIRCLFDFNSIQFSFFNSLRKSAKTISQFSKEQAPTNPAKRISLHQHIQKIENYDLIKPHLSEFSESAVLDSLSNVILKE